MRVLVGCERSGVLRRELLKRGHIAYSCDLEPADDGEKTNHIQYDVLQVMNSPAYGAWDAAFFFPDCTYLTSAGLHWNKVYLGRIKQTEAAAEFFMECINAPIDKIVVENPIGCMSTRYRKPDQIIQPYQFGDDASKATCLWLKNLPKLAVDPALRVLGRWVNGKERWSNQTDSGQNKLGPSPDRAQKRSETYPGIAKALADLLD